MEYQSKRAKAITKQQSQGCQFWHASQSGQQCWCVCMHVCGGVCVTGASDDKRWQIGVKASCCSFTMPTENRDKEAFEKKKRLSNTDRQPVWQMQLPSFHKRLELQKGEVENYRRTVPKRCICKAFITFYFFRLTLFLIYQRLHGHLKPGKYRSDLNT